MNTNNNGKFLKNQNPKDTIYILELFNSKKFIHAEQEIEKNIKTYPNSFVLYNILGAVFAEQDRLDDAINKYNKSIKVINLRYQLIWYNSSPWHSYHHSAQFNLLLVVCKNKYRTLPRSLRRMMTRRPPPT